MFPPLHYSFFAPPRIVFGWGRRREIGPLAQPLGRRALLITGSRTLEQTGVIEEIAELLREAGIEPVSLGSITREPEVADVDQMTAKLSPNSPRPRPRGREVGGEGAGVHGSPPFTLLSPPEGGEGSENPSILRANGPTAHDFIVAVGGGSAMDLAKAVAAMATNANGHSVADFLEGVGIGLQITQPPLPVLAMPTTAGTGSEATKNAVISSFDPPFKKSLRSDRMVPRVVLVDPELTVSVPPSVTAHTGMDAITQLIESYVSKRAAPIPQALCLQGLELAVPSLTEAVENGHSREARERMSHAALLSGIALANSGLGLAHGVAAALGVHCRVPHGLACAVMLPVAMRVNREVRRTEFARLGELFTGRSWPSEAAAADAAIGHIQDLCDRIGIPRRLSQIGVRAEQIPELVPASRGNSMNGNPRDLSDDELRTLLEGIL